MDYHHPHGYTRPPPPPPPPPPPSAADPYQRPPPPNHHPWPYSSPQFQFQPQPQPQSQPSLSPPPQQWPPPPPPHHPAHQPPPYPAHPHYPPPPPPHHFSPRPPPQSYSQDWGSGSWSHNQNWQYPTSNNEEDWAAKAKAWADAKAATENQHPSSQFVPAGRPEEQNHFHDQYSQSNDPQFLNAHGPNYPQYPGSAGPPNRTSLGQLQDSQYINSGQSSYAADVHVPFAARDGSLAGDSMPALNPFVRQQEVPSSYSSVAGNEEAGDRYDKFNSSSSLSVAPLSQQHVQPLLPPGGGRTGWMEEPHNLGNLPPEPTTDLSDQPLNFAPHFNRNMDPHAQPNYNHSSGGPVRGGEPNVAMSSNYAWGPSTAPGAVYPPLPPTVPSGPQVDHPMAMPSPASGHSAPMFPTGPSFQPTAPMIGAAFGIGGGVTPHPTAFPGDAYGVSERPKKASVPNWLREEIIKNKAVITSSAPEFPNEDSQSIEEDSVDKSSREGYHVDSKSIDSSKSAEDEDEDEDEVEAARTAAVNQEIKRVLTEVLLKVTDELFDEIATKVLKEDDLSVEVGRDVDLSNHQILPSTKSVLTPKASAKVLIPITTKESDYEDASEKSTSGFRGDVLGLGNYASDEEDEEIQSSGKLKSKESSTHQQSSSSKLLQNNSVSENGGSLVVPEGKRSIPVKMDTDGTPDRSVVNMDLSDDRAARDLASSDDRRSLKGLSRITEDESHHGPGISRNNSLIEKVVERNEDGNFDSELQDIGNRYDKNDRLENKRSSVKKDHKDSESPKERLDKKGDEEHGRRSRTERTDHHDSSKDKGKDKARTDEKIKKTESRKRRSPSDDKEGITDKQRDKRTSGKKETNEKRQDRTGEEKRERSRHKSESESSRHKRRRSNDASDVSSDDSRRKSHHSRRRKSPSPQRKRHVSRSPHSKHSKRRHSPYSSLETPRGKTSASRSRSRSPVHRRR